METIRLWLGVKLTKVAGVFNIKVKSIHRVGQERTRIGIGVKLILWAEGIPQKVSEPLGFEITGQRLRGSFTTDRQHDGLSHRLADRDVLPDLVTAAEKLRASVESAIALVAKVRARPAANGAGVHIDKTQVNDV